MTTEKTEVLVIGGGPAGTTAAYQLATAGIRVMLVDRSSFPREKVCGESLSPGALGRLRALGMWPPQGPAAAEALNSRFSAMAVRGMRIRSPRGTTFLGRYRNVAHGAGLAIRRTVFDNELLASARSRGVQVVEGVEALTATRADMGRAVVHVRPTGGGALLRIEAGRVIVADGRRSFLARQLGFIEAESASRGQRRYAVQAHCEGVAGLSDLAEMQVGVGGYCGVAPLSNTSANICYVLFARRLDMAPRTIEADFRRHLDRFPEIRSRLALARLQGQIHVVGPLRQTSRKQSLGPFIAAGDTTGFLDPFTGEGIAHAIASGALAAEAVRRSLAGRVDAFHDYEREIRALRKLKGRAALLLYGLVSRPTLANAAAAVFAGLPRLGDAVVRLFGDQV